MKLPGWIGAVVVAALAMATRRVRRQHAAAVDVRSAGQRASASPATNGSAGIRRRPTPSQLATFRYAAYVDGNSRRARRRLLRRRERQRRSRATAGCPRWRPAPTRSSSCRFVVDNGIVIESGRSAALRVTVTGATAGTASPPTLAAHRRSSTTADGAELRLDVAHGRSSTSPTAIAVAPDGRVFVAERAGRVRVLRERRARSAARARHRRGADDERLRGRTARAGPRCAVRAHALRLRRLHRRRPRTSTRRFRVVALPRSRRPARRARRAARSGFRPRARPAAALGDRPGWPAVCRVRRRPPAPAARPALASYSGKILRLNTDGTTPQDQPAGIPVFASRLSVAARAGLASGDRRALDRRREAARLEELRVSLPPAERRARRPRRGSPLPPGPAPRRSPSIAGRSCRRWRAICSSPPKKRVTCCGCASTSAIRRALVSSERLLQDVGGPIRAVASRPTASSTWRPTRRAAAGAEVGSLLLALLLAACSRDR